MSHTAVGTCSTAEWGVSFVKGCATVAAVDSVSGIDTRGCLSHSWADHHHGPRDGQDTDLSSRIAQSAGPCRVGVSPHIPGDIVSFPHQHSAEGAVLTTTSQCEFRSQRTFRFTPLGLAFCFLPFVIHPSILGGAARRQQAPLNHIYRFYGCSPGQPHPGESQALSTLTR